MLTLFHKNMPLLLICVSAVILVLNNTCDPQTSSESEMVKTEIYFGLQKGNGSVLTSQEWENFLNHHITTHFKEGLTVIDAAGQYLDASSNLIKEKTKLVILIYRNSIEKQKSLEWVCSKYKEFFKQESVLVLTSKVQVRFE